MPTIWNSAPRPWREVTWIWMAVLQSTDVKMAGGCGNGCSVTLFLTGVGRDVSEKCRSNCDRLKQELQETLDELKSIQLINELLQKEINVKHVVKHVSINTKTNMNNMDGVNYDDERDYGIDNTGWIQVVNDPKRKTSKTQNYYRKSKQVAITNRFASLRYLQESEVNQHENDPDT